MLEVNVVGYKPVDEEWNRMLAVYNACKNNKIGFPKEVVSFFEQLIECGENPNDLPGIEVDLGKSPAVSEYMAEMKEGCDIEIGKLPKDIKVIRVYKSY